MSKHDGGPAFPLPAPLSETGMTMRDYFAAAALQGVMKDRENVKALAKAADQEKQDPAAFIASRMFNIADAMLAEREKE